MTCARAPRVAQERRQIAPAGRRDHRVAGRHEAGRVVGDGDADVGGGERAGVVQPVADHQHVMAGGLLRLARRRACPPATAGSACASPKTARHRAALAVVVAREQPQSSCDGASAAPPRRCPGAPAPSTRIQPAQRRRPRAAHGACSARRPIGDARSPRRRRPARADRDTVAVDDAARCPGPAISRTSLTVGRRRRATPAGDGAADRMDRLGGEPPDQRASRVASSRAASTRAGASGRRQRAGLVEGDGVDAAEVERDGRMLQIAARAPEHAHRRAERDRRGQRQRARARDDSTAVATCARHPASGHHAIAPAAASATAPTVNQAPKRAETSVSQCGFGRGEDRVVPEAGEMAVRHVAHDAQPQRVADDAAAGAHRSRRGATATGVCSPVTKA